MAPRKPAARRPPGSEGEGEGESEETAPPFFNTTFSAHRVSPLFVGSEELTRARLELLAHRLRDTLVGDVVRGIQVGLEATDTPMGQVGSLRAVKIRRFQAASLLGEDAASDAGQSPDKQKQGLWIELRHENAAYVALMLPGSSGGTSTTASGWAMSLDKTKGDKQADSSQFLHLPLLLLRMPLPLKGVIGDWLSTTFDCRVSKVVLGTRTLVNVWEGWIRETGLSSKGPDFVVTLAFNTPLAEDRSATISDSEGELDKDAEAAVGSGLRTMDITISPPDLRRFVQAGKADGPLKTAAGPWENDVRERRRLAGGNVDDGWAWRTGQQRPEQPFAEALARYLDHHLALNMFHPSVRVVQISCGGFVLAQSRLKIVKLGDVTEELSRAAWMFVTKLGDRVRGEGFPSVV